MEQIGKVFRQLRESRNISLRQATGGQFSPSMLSRFETGQSELSVEKFLFALENISASVEEILFLARGFQYDTDSELRKEITDVLEPKNIAPLEDLYRREYQKHAHSHNKQKHILNAIMIKSYMKSMDERVESRKARKRWRMLSVFLRCLAVINLPNTIEIRPNVEYLQTKKKFEAIELLPFLRSLQKFYRFLLILFVAYIQKNCFANS